MKLRKSFLFMFVLMALLLQACAPDTQSAIATGIFETQQISALQTAAAGGGGGGQPPADTGGGQPAGPSNTPQPSETPTITLTNTPSVPYVSVSSDTNCRTGPNSYYGYVTTITIGQQLEVVAVLPSSDYVVVKNPGGTGNCWLWLRYANTTDFSAFNLPVATVPPTPFPTATATPAFDWDGSWTTWVSGSPYSVVINQSGGSVSGTFSIGGGDSVSISGSLSANFQVASGTWSSTPGDSGPFQFQIKSGNLNQFIGSGELGGVTFPWCGARLGASMPSPCQWP